MYIRRDIRTITNRDSMFAIDQFKIGDYLVVIVNIALKKSCSILWQTKTHPY